MIYLDHGQVRDMIKTAENADETIIIRCIRKGPASKAGGPDEGDIHTLVCGRKPDYQPLATRDRKAEDSKNGVLTVYAVNRSDTNTGLPGAWRRVNLMQVTAVIYQENEYRVVHN